MNQIGSTRLPTVNASEADAGGVRRGASQNNHGLRLLVSQAQRRRKDRAIMGSFVILDADDNKHAQSLAALLHRSTDAAGVPGGHSPRPRGVHARRQHEQPGPGARDHPRA
jgi:hypothetical protein